MPIRNALVLLFGLCYGLFYSISIYATPHFILNHQLNIQTNLEKGTIIIDDELVLPKEYPRVFAFQLNKNMQVEYQGKVLKPIRSNNGLNDYQIDRKNDTQKITLRYSGKLPSTPNCQFTQQVCSLLNQEGIYLNPALAWYPLTDHRQTFELKVYLPEGWKSLSQGIEIAENHWKIDKPQDAIYLIAGQFKVYKQAGDIAEAQVYLRKDDPELAKQYLQATQHYLSHYQNILGDYPYKKFATIESFWESGWGMPSFTLLGPRVMRMPFILHSSLPHEILHNWWGNGVYIDASKGNWSEGLTAYLADYALQERRQKGIQYRRTALDKYAVFTQSGNDFPIAQFRSRHSPATQAIGYSKLLMVFHMLRKDIGDKAFFAALRDFYQTYQFKQANMDDLANSLSKSTGKDLSQFFSQWINQTDAPSIKIKDWKLNGEKVELTITQQSSQSAFSLNLPIVAFSGKQIIWQDTLPLKENEQAFSIKIPKNADTVQIDPFFDVLRKPLKEEIPANLYSFRDPSLKSLSVSRSAKWWDDIASDLVQTMPKAFAHNQANASTHLQLGIDNAARLSQLEITANHYIFKHGDQDKRFDKAIHGIAYATNQADQKHIIIDAPNPELTHIMLRKLRHYGKYSYLVFDQSGKNVLKGEWELDNSPLQFHLPKL